MLIRNHLSYAYARTGETKIRSVAPYTYAPLEKCTNLPRIGCKHRGCWLVISWSRFLKGLCGCWKREHRRSEKRAEGREFTWQHESFSGAMG